jgi:AcrR family transcriptional regulator
MSQLTKKNIGRPRSIESYQAILQATLDLLAKLGFERMSIEAIASYAGVGKNTIYRRYSSKLELVTDALESNRKEVFLPNTGSLKSDLKALIQNFSVTFLNPLERQTIFMLLDDKSRNSQLVNVYRTKYLQPRREAFAVVLERAKVRNEISTDINSDIIFDMLNGMILFSLISKTTKTFEIYSVLSLILGENVHI